MASLFCFPIEIPGPVRLAVILELERIAADECFGRSDKAAQCLLIVLDQPAICCIGRIAGHDQENRDHMLIAAKRIHAVSKVLENKPFI